ncbi:MAG: helix-turn-helix domain-containing protein [Gemmataceae bacterium]|nr:helix-turn-helix domain-containing protein [Gemmataceae bacterium]
MLSAKQAAEQLGVSDSLVYAWCAAWVLPHCRMGRPGKRSRIPIDPADLATFLADRKRAGGGPKPPPFTLKHIKVS